MGQHVFVGREGVPNKLQILGAASAMEESTKKINANARKLREHLASFSPAELMDSTNSRSSEISMLLDELRKSLRGLDSLYDQMAGQPLPNTSAGPLNRSITQSELDKPLTSA